MMVRQKFSAHAMVICFTIAVCWLNATVALAQTSVKPDTLGKPATDQRRPDLANPGGVTASDFTPLIDLIQSTVDSDVWAESGTGSATLQPFVSGVFADADGTLRFASREQEALRPEKTSTERMARPRRLLEKAQPAASDETGADNPRSDSAQRFVSLRRLEGYIAQQLDRNQPLPEEVLTLAGLQQIQYVILVSAADGQPGDIVLAGPAGDWRTNPDGIIVSTDSGLPVLRLDDLITLWRRENPTEPFGVTIEPRQAGLKSLQQYLRATTRKPIKPSKRQRWVDGLRDNLGKQDVKYFGLKPQSHVARVLLIADYHMKCIGMGLAGPVDDVDSYLQTIQLDENGQVPPMTVLRWWFAMNYQPVLVSEDGQVFGMNGQGAKVLSENQLLTVRGQRVATGKSEPLNRQFADSFTKQFSQICADYPLYGELKNVFDLAMTLAVIQRRQLVERAGWQPELLLDRQRLKLPEVEVADEVEPIVNHRVIDGKQIVAGVSGGVWVDAQKHLQVSRADTSLGINTILPADGTPESNLWWWD